MSSLEIRQSLLAFGNLQSPTLTQKMDAAADNKQASLLFTCFHHH